MPGLLSALNLARSGMAASQKSMEVVGNNVANVNTEGYSRQTIQSEALPTVESGGLSFGQGVQISGIDRAQDSFITDRLRAAGEQLGDAEAKASPLADLERILNIGEDSLAGKIDDFFGAWQELSLNPGGEVERGIVMRSAEVLGTQFNEVETSLDRLRHSIDSSLSAKIGGVNAKLEQVASLNGKIQQSLAVGKDPNTALDQRDQLLQDLSQSIGASAVQGEKGMVSVHLPGGLTLVQETNAYELSTGESQNGVQDYTLEMGSSTMTLERSDLGGEFGGLVDVRDEVVTTVQEDITKLRESLVEAVNTQHRLGTGLDGSTGQDFFKPDASTLQLAIDDIDAVAAGTTDAPGDNANAKAIASLVDDTTVDGTYAFGDFYGKIAAEVGIEVQQNDFQRTSFQDTLDQLKNRRDEIAGVSIDESMIDLQRYQKSFQASAKYMTTVDQMMQTLLNIKR